MESLINTNEDVSSETVEIELSTEEFANLALKAHKLDMTFNEYVNEALLNYVRCLKVNSVDIKSE